MFGNMLTPKNIIGFIKNNADINKIFQNLINSQEAKEFIENDLGKNYEGLKTNLLAAYTTTENSNVGLKRAQKLEETKKLEMYKDLANRLINNHRIKLSLSYNFSRWIYPE